jgi:hypothetical protein
LRQGFCEPREVAVDRILRRGEKDVRQPLAKDVFLDEPALADAPAAADQDEAAHARVADEIDLPSERGELPLAADEAR